MPDNVKLLCRTFPIAAKEGEFEEKDPRGNVGRRGLDVVEKGLGRAFEIAFREKSFCFVPR